ncbi:peptidylprolyl isomerase [Pseudonocardia sediminis]|nr:peptidylprolyl isomerase [Pseudonocardia sediminis]
MATNEMRREAAKRKLANQQAHRAERARKRKRTATIASIATVVVVVVAVIAVFALTGNGSSTDTEAAAPPPANGPDTSGLPVAPLPTRPTALPASVNCTYTPGEQAAKPVNPPANGPVSTQGQVPATLDTSAGAVGLTLNRALAPCAVNSFVSLVKQGYLNDTPCHRLTTGEGLQVLQCGDPTGIGTGGPGYKFDDEVFEGLKYGRGMLAMANSGPNTNGSQFFMIFGDAQLPPNYSVFGSIDAGGLATLDKIAKAGDDSVNGPGDGKPNVPVTIRSATVQA